MLAMAQGAGGGSAPKNGNDPLGITIFILIVGAIIYLFLKSIAPPSEKQTSPPTPALATQEYVILVGSFDKRAEANHIAQQLRENRISGRVTSQDGHFFVTVGKYATESQAQSDLKRIHEKGFADAKVIRPKL